MRARRRRILNGFFQPPTVKLADRPAAIASVHRMLEHTRVDALLVGDGWPIFRDARTELAALVAELMA